MSNRIDARYEGKLDWPLGYARTDRDARKPGRFRKNRNPVSIAEALTRVEIEISSFTRTGRGWRTTEIVITANLVPLARGGFRSDMKETDDRGVAVYFHLDGKPLTFCCDRWYRTADNICAIAAFLEAMRKMEQWGVAESNRMFTGFAALPAPGESEAVTWWRVLELDPHQKFTAAELKTAWHAKLKTTPEAERAQVNVAYQQSLESINA